ncbi:GntR family transcriptional regulator [Virgibacillus xinjiangensis]|uniref:GntR family transcriptional regulator n=1 Tax=Virgibacillus xinjiangensis TaxID=393090 RepID=A0ABV7CTR1_9BACI
MSIFLEKGSQTAMEEDRMIVQKPLSELIAEELRQRIWNKQVQFGERLLETELAEMFDVSRSTIREALKILEQEQLVISKARKGTYVTEFTDEDLAEIIELRTLMEAHAFQDALPELGREHFAKLSEILDEMKTAAGKGKWGDLFDLDMKLHGYIVNQSGNSRIIRIYESIQVQIRAYLVHLDQYYSSPHSFYAEHRELVDALKTKDPQKVNRSVRDHISYVEEKLLQTKQKQ